jgi:uncharacterized protein YjbJ (UPF0337 family)
MTSTQAAPIAQTDKLNAIMRAEVGHGAGNHVKNCNHFMPRLLQNRDIPPLCPHPHWRRARSPGTCCVTATFDPLPIFRGKEVPMNKDRVAGATKEAVGGIKEKAGKALGDTKMEVEGKAKKVEGKVQNAAGKVEDEVSDAARRADDAARRADKGRW